MSIDQTKVVDYVSVDRATGNVWLSISDHLPWVTAESEHMILFQEKVNSYIDFIESGELLRKFPSTKNRSVAIRVTSKFPLNQNEKTV